MNTSTRMYICTCIYTYVCVCIYIYISLCVYIYIYIYTHTHICNVYMYINKHMYIHIYIHICIHPPAPMNHVENVRAGPAKMPFQNWYTANTNHFRLTDFCQVAINNTTGLRNKHRTACSCAEDQILKNKMSGTGF